jgi:hypothetical protein
MITQRSAGVLRSESFTALQDWYDVVDERG